MHLRRSGRVRYGVPFAVAGVVALLAAVPSLRPGPGHPQLPNVTVAQLLAKAASPRYGVWKGDIHWIANLGLPSLGDVGFASGGGGDVDWAALASGSHDVKVWSDGNRLRLALLGPSNEVDLYAGAGGTWFYDSVTNTATRLAARSAPSAAVRMEAAGPAQVGKQLLGQVGGLTDIRFGPSTVVAGRPAYQLILTPRPGTEGAAVTTLGRITVAVDAANGVILRVDLYAAGSRQPAFELGYRSVDFLAPGRHLPASTFTFTPGPGVSVSVRRLGPTAAAEKASSDRSQATNQVAGSGWGAVVVVPGGTAPSSVGRALGALATPVRGAWGSGRLLQTGLFNALILPRGDIAVGMVTPAGLEAAVAGRAG